MKNRLSLMMLMLCLCGIAVAQEDNRPGWLSNKPTASNSTYFYVVERGSGSTVDEAANNALLKVFRTTMMRIGAVVSWEEVNSSLQNGTDWGTVAMKYNIPINKVCEYVEHKTNKGFVVAVLCQVAKSGAVYPEFDDFSACSDTKSYSNVAAALKSAIVPGLGQIGKNHDTEGLITMGSEAALLSGAAATYIIGKSRITKMSGASPYNFYRYANQYSTLKTINATVLSAAAVVYVFNICRAYSMKMDYVSIEPALIRTNQSMTTGIGITFNL